MFPPVVEAAVLVLRSRKLIKCVHRQLFSLMNFLLEGVNLAFGVVLVTSYTW